MVDNLKERLRKSWGQLIPEQKRWLVRVLLFTGLAILWRVAQNIWPSMALSLIGIVIFIICAICFVNFLVRLPSLHGLIKWSIPLFIGGFLNQVVILANGGFMPSTCQDIVRCIYSPIQDVCSGIYCPMYSASFAHLGDRLWGFISLGDVLMIVAFVGIMATLIRKQEHKLVEQCKERV